MWQLSFLASLKEAEHFASLLEDSCLAISWFEKGSLSQIWQVEVLFEERPQEKWLKTLLGIQPYKLVPLPDINWLAENRKSFPALIIGPFYIYGSHHKEVIPAGKISFKIDAATAFGTGRHATTRGCLLALDDLKRAGVLVRRYLDLGCGTAVLAMGMARLFQVRGIAADNDPEAVDRARFNLERNHLSKLVKVVASEGFADPAVRSYAPYDLIAANILADPLMLLSSDMARFTALKGRIILSGLLQTQQPQVVEIYKKRGFLLEKTYPIDEWTTLVMKKSL